MSLQPSVEGIWAQTMENHATGNFYNGPPTGGDMYCGWPLVPLAQQALPYLSTFEQLRAIAELKKGHHFTVAGQVLFGAASPFPPAHSNEDMLSMRMRWSNREWAKGFAHVAVHLTGGKAHIWVITIDAQALTLEDDASLYPSDALITKLNMLKQE